MKTCLQCIIYLANAKSIVFPTHCIILEELNVKGVVVGWDSENFLYYIGTSPGVARLACSPLAVCLVGRWSGMCFDVVLLHI